MSMSDLSAIEACRTLIEGQFVRLRPLQVDAATVAKVRAAVAQMKVAQMEVAQTEATQSGAQPTHSPR